jgi:hypothetical protein
MLAACAAVPLLGTGRHLLAADQSNGEEITKLWVHTASEIIDLQLRGILDRRTYSSRAPEWPFFRSHNIAYDFGFIGLEGAENSVVVMGHVERAARGVAEMAILWAGQQKWMASFPPAYDAHEKAVTKERAWRRWHDLIVQVRLFQDRSDPRNIEDDHWNGVIEMNVAFANDVE